MCLVTYMNIGIENKYVCVYVHVRVHVHVLSVLAILSFRVLRNTSMTNHTLNADT